ncbi:MAG: C40 family peptidase [Gammaproteobacteria bacterium]|nr:C40 family peptidase [Gammaproteobacteria bacterium]
MTGNRTLARSLAASLVFLICSCANSPATTADVRRGDAATVQTAAAKVAKSMVGKRYRYGGNHPAKGFDCSGLVHYSYGEAGMNVARSTTSQRKATRAITASSMRIGDLLFFNQEGKKSSHVGIYIGNQQFVHAPSSGKKVRIDRLDTPYWRKHWASIRRFIDL